MIEGTFIAIPTIIAADKQLSDTAKLLAGWITSLSNKHGYTWATNQYLADAMGVAQRTVQKAVQQLVEAGYLERKIEYERKQVKARYLRLSFEHKRQDNAYPDLPAEQTIPDTPGFTSTETPPHAQSDTIIDNTKRISRSTRTREEETPGVVTKENLPKPPPPEFDRTETPHQMPEFRELTRNEIEIIAKATYLDPKEIEKYGNQYLYNQYGKGVRIFSAAHMVIAHLKSNVFQRMRAEDQIRAQGIPGHRPIQGRNQTQHQDIDYPEL